MKMQGKSHDGTTGILAGSDYSTGLASVWKEQQETARAYADALRNTLSLFVGSEDSPKLLKYALGLGSSDSVSRLEAAIQDAANMSIQDPVGRFIMGFPEMPFSDVTHYLQRNGHGDARIFEKALVNEVVGFALMGPANEVLKYAVKGLSELWRLDYDRHGITTSRQYFVPGLQSTIQALNMPSSWNNLVKDQLFTEVAHLHGFYEGVFVTAFNHLYARNTEGKPCHDHSFVSRKARHYTRLAMKDYAHREPSHSTA